MSVLLLYAKNSYGKSTHVDDVPNGAACNCSCPKCGAKLIAKNDGEVRDHHFAHLNGNKCKEAVESAIHLLAKEVIQEAGGIMLPENLDSSLPSGFVHLNNIEIEKWDNTLKIIPDAEGYTQDGKRILIEFYFKHKIEGEKRKIIIDNNLLCVQVNLNYEKQDKVAIRNI